MSPPSLTPKPVASLRRSSAGVSVDVDRFRRDRGVDQNVCFAMDGAPLGASDLRHTAAGAIVMRTKATGWVTEVGPDRLRLEAPGMRCTVRYLLPDGVSLADLMGHPVAIEVKHVLRHGREPIVDATIRDTAGRLILWARDGGIAPDRVAHGVVLRVAHAEVGAPRLALAGPHGVTSIPARQSAELRTDEGRFSVLVLRVADDEASFVFARAR